MTENLLDFIQRDTGPEPQWAVIWLHGLGADGHDFEPLVPELGLPTTPALRFIFPHAPSQPVTINGGMVMRAWYDIAALDLSAQVDAAGIERSIGHLGALLAATADGGIPAERTVLAGFSQGGVIALHAGLAHPQRLAGIIALSTYVALPEFVQDSATSANRELPIFMAHGRQDPVIPVTLGERSRDFLLKQGYPVQWQAYAMEHAVCREEIDDLAGWLRTRLAA